MSAPCCSLVGKWQQFIMRVPGNVEGQGHGARRALTRDLGLLAGVAGVAGVARVEHLFRARQVLVRLLWHPWKAGRG